MPPLRRALGPQPNPPPAPPAAQGFRKIAGEQGVRGLFRGWVPTAFGYSAQGAFKVRAGIILRHALFGWLPLLTGHAVPGVFAAPAA